MKLLLITYYFPPCGGAAVQRWLRFIKALHRKNVQVTVITTFEGDYPYTDESLIKSIPPDLKVLRCKPLGFSQLWKALGQKELPYGSLQNKAKDTFVKKVLFWLRLNLVVPDMRIGWNRAAYKLARQELMADKYDCVITTGPPHSTHLVPLILKKKLGFRWIADWRDPWSGIYYLKLSPPSSLSMLIHKRLEAKVCKRADLNLMISKHMWTTLPAGHKLLLRNGFDAEEISSAKQSVKSGTETGFIISYVGQITAGQNLDALTQILSILSEMPEAQVRFIGSRLNESQINLLAERLGISYSVLPFMSHQKALSLMASSSMLLLLINNYEGFEGMLTTKLYEYLGMGIPILALGPRGGEAEELIRTYNAGLCVEASQIDIARAWITSLYTNHQENKPVAEYRAPELSSAYQARILLNALEQKIGIDKKSDHIVL